MRDGRHDSTRRTLERTLKGYDLSSSFHPDVHVDIERPDRSDDEHRVHGPGAG